jgi:hypothetical protein
MLKALPIRSGNWNNAATAGVFTLNCNNARTNANNNIGARPDSMPRTSQGDCGLKGGAFLHLAKASAKSAGRPLTSRHHVVLERLGAIL